MLKDYERVHGTDNFLSDDFKACDIKCIEFEMVRFSSEVLGVVTGSPIDDDGGAEEPAQDLNDLVARKNFLRMQDWDYNRSVLVEKLRPIDQKLLALDPMPWSIARLEKKSTMERAARARQSAWFVILQAYLHCLRWALRKQRAISSVTYTFSAGFSRFTI